MNKKILIIGKTNVGKSTLFNMFVNKKHSIETNKKNTTIRYIEKKFKNNIYVDSPGPIIKKMINNFNTNKFIYNKINEVNIIIILIDRTILKSDDFFLFDIIKNLNKKKILIINKIDKIKNKHILLPFIQNLSTYLKFDHIIPTSKYDTSNIKIIQNIINNYTCINAKQLTYEPDTNNIQIYDKIKKIMLENFDKEIPYTTKIIIDTNTINLLKINLITRKPNQKKIIIGANGIKIKNIRLKILYELKNIIQNIKIIVN